MKSTKGLTIALSLLLSAVAGYPAIAQANESTEGTSQNQLKQFEPSTEESEPGATPLEPAQTEPEPLEEPGATPSEGMEMTQPQAMRGEIVGIVGNTITVEMEDGTIETFEGVSGAGTESLAPGMTVYVSEGVLYADETAQEPLTSPSTEAQTENGMMDSTSTDPTQSEGFEQDGTSTGVPSTVEDDSPRLGNVDETETEDFPAQTVQDSAPTTESETEFDTQDDTEFDSEAQETEPVRALW